MMTWMENAWGGWQDFITDGKLPALLMVVLLFYWFCVYEKIGGTDTTPDSRDDLLSPEKKAEESQRALWIYTTLLTICCICPVTAAILMQYQTKFYDYQWIWNAVPLTIIIALGGTLIWDRYRRPAKTGRNLGLVVLLILPILLAGCLGKQPMRTKAEDQTWVHSTQKNDITGRTWENDGQDEISATGASTMQGEVTATQVKNIAGLLENLNEQHMAASNSGQAADNQTANNSNQAADSQTAATPHTSMILWAPRQIMEMARSLDGSIALVYGRNMWDQALSAYSYDTYGPEQKALYQWMSELEKNGEALYPVETCVEYMKYMDINTLVLPGNVTSEVLGKMEQALGATAVEMDGYYCFIL